VTGYPYFLTNRLGVNLAQVYHYGLRDAARPPFSPVAVPVLPLPPLTGAEQLPVTLAAAGQVLVWDGAAERLRPAERPGGALPLELEVVPAATGSAGRPQRTVDVRLPPGPYARFRLLLSAPINGTIVDLGPGARDDGVLHVELPVEFLRTTRHLYGGSAFWWIEVRDAEGRLRGITRMRRVEHVEAIVGR
jgi:hypothetical protein